jgi:hypothetical protein
MSDNEKALQTIPEDWGALEGTASRPEGIDGSDRSGTEDIRADEIRLPRLAIGQGLSPQLIPGTVEYIKGLSIGQMFNDVSEEIYGEGPLMLVPVKRHVTRIEFDPKDKNRPLDRNVPAGDPRLEWDGENPPRATEFVEFISLLLRPGKSPEGVVVSIKTTNKEQRKAAKLWTTYISQTEGPIYARLYKVSSKIVRGKNKKGEDTTYGVFMVKNAGFIPTDKPSGAALFAYAKQFHEAMKDQVVETSRDGAADDEGDTSFDAGSFEGRGEATEM